MVHHKMIGLKRGQLLRSLLAILLIGLSWWGIFAARDGLVVRSLERNHVPLLYLAPPQGHAPGVLIAHGFAGSKQLMLGYGHVLARAGYAVMLWDFDGHGANPAALKGFELQQNLEVALEGLVEQPEVDRDRLALLGHSMGSGVVMSAGIQNVERFAATIAISPTGQNVTPQAPRNLQLQIGAWEGGLLPYAQRLLADAGGANLQFAQRQARELVTVPTVEHITILFSQASHQAALRWLDATFGLQSQSKYVDRRMSWYFLHLVGWLLLLSVMAPGLALSATLDFEIPRWRKWGGLIASPIVALGGLLLLNPLIDLQVLGGIQVGGAVGIWFLIAGLSWLGILGRLPRLSWQMTGLGVTLFGLLWVAVGAMAQVVWLQWWLIPARLTIWLPIAIACLPWFLASGMVQQETRWLTRLAWWFGQSLMLIAGFLLAIVCLPKLGFMFLLLPLFPLVMALFAVISSLFNQAWVYAIGNALFFAWLLAAGFPLSACCLAFE